MTRLGGYYFEDGQRRQLALVQSATVAEVEAALRLCRSEGLVDHAAGI